MENDTVDDITVQIAQLVWGNKTARFWITTYLAFNIMILVLISMTLYTVVRR